MAEALEPGDKVGWGSSGGSRDGEVVRRLTVDHADQGARRQADAGRPAIPGQERARPASDAAHKPETLRRT